MPRFRHRRHGHPSRPWERARRPACTFHGCERRRTYSCRHRIVGRPVIDASKFIHAARSTGRDFPAVVTTPRKRSTRRRGRGTAATQLTSTSTSRTAYAETKRWLIQQHGPVCAYCGRRVPATTITLDHVAPRRGQSAYDRRDNLVLACTDCNGAKADMPILAFLLRKRERASMLRRSSAARRRSARAVTLASAAPRIFPRGR